MDMDLDPDAQALLDAIAPPAAEQHEAVADDDDIVFSPSTETAKTEGEPPAGYVSRSDFDRISGQVEQLTKLLGGRDAAAPASVPVQPAQPVYAPAPQAPVDTEALKKTLNEKFFEDPIAMMQALQNNAIASVRNEYERKFADTQATIARGEAARLREEYARSYPEFKAALPAMDKLISETPPDVLAQLLQSGRLRTVYEDNFKAKAFDIATKITTGARTRRAAPTQDDPPQLGGRGLASVSSLDRVRSGSKEIRMSDLNEVDREAVIQMRKQNFTPEQIARALEAS